MASKPKPDALQCFNIANAFHEGSIRCAVMEPNPDTGVLLAPLPPELVNAAFAAELYMKALVLRRLPEVEGHNLKWLYDNALDDAERVAISGHYQALLGSTDEWLRKNLEIFARAFTEWRYVYEADARFVNAAALLGFMQAAYLAIRDIAPEWAMSDYEHKRFTARRESAAVWYSSKGMTLTEALSKMGINRPHADIAKGDNQNFGVAPPILDLDSEAASVKTKIDGGSDPDNRGSDKAL